MENWMQRVSQTGELSVDRQTSSIRLLLRDGQRLSDGAVTLLDERPQQIALTVGVWDALIARGNDLPSVIPQVVRAAPPVQSPPQQQVAIQTAVSLF